MEKREGQGEIRSKWVEPRIPTLGGRLATLELAAERNWRLYAGGMLRNDVSDDFQERMIANSAWIAERVAMETSGSVSRLIGGPPP
ncbi:MAG TPA: hypothetical protein VIM46_04485 [Luteolibacter sp.]